MIPKIVVCRVHAHIHCGCVLYLTSIPPLTVFDDDAHDHDHDDDDDDDDDERENDEDVHFH